MFTKIKLSTTIDFISDAFVYINFADDLLHYGIIEISFLIKLMRNVAPANIHTSRNTIAQL